MKLIILFLTVIMLFKPLWPLVEYVSNYDYIVENLCENKDKPMLNCNGKCYLAKILAKESKEEQKNPFDNKLSKSEIPIINWVNEQFIILAFFKPVVNQFKWCFQTTSYLHVFDILQPPQLS